MKEGQKGEGTTRHGRATARHGAEWIDHERAEELRPWIWWQVRRGGRGTSSRLGVMWARVAQDQEGNFVRAILGR